MRLRWMMMMGCSLGSLATGCGDDAAEERAYAAFASPAVMIPAGARSLEIPLEACTTNRTSATNMVLVVTDDGGMEVRGSIDGGPVASFLSIPYAEAIQRYIDAEVSYDANGTFTGGAYAELEGPDTSIDLDGYAPGRGVYAYGVDDWVNCSIPDAAPAIFPVAARMPARRLGDELLGGVTTVLTSGVQSATLVPPVLTWDNWYTGATGDAALAAIRYLRFDGSRGVLRAAASADATATGLEVPLSLPASTPPGGPGVYMYEYDDVDDGAREYELETTVGPTRTPLELYLERRWNAVEPFAQHYGP